MHDPEDSLISSSFLCCSPSLPARPPQPVPADCQVWVHSGADDPNKLRLRRGVWVSREGQGKPGFMMPRSLDTAPRRPFRLLLHAGEWLQVAELESARSLCLVHRASLIMPLSQGLKFKAHSPADMGVGKTRTSSGEGRTDLGCGECGRFWGVRAGVGFTGKGRGGLGNFQSGRGPHATEGESGGARLRRGTPSPHLPRASLWAIPPQLQFLSPPRGGVTFIPRPRSHS